MKQDILISIGVLISCLLVSWASYNAGWLNGFEACKKMLGEKKK